MRGRKIGACSQQRLQAGRTPLLLWCVCVLDFCMLRFKCLECCVIICLCVRVFVYAGTRSADGPWTACRVFSALMYQYGQHEGQERQKVGVYMIKGRFLQNSFSVLSPSDLRRRILMSSFCFADCPSPKAIFPGWQNVPTSTMRLLTLAPCRWGFLW